MTEQINKLNRGQKVFGVLFVFSIVFTLCVCTPVSPAPFYKDTLASALSAFQAGIFGGGEIRVAGTPLSNILAILFGSIGGCFLIVSVFIGFCLVTVVKWWSKIRENNERYLEMQKIQVELSKQRLEIEKQRFELEKERTGTEKNR